MQNNNDDEWKLNAHCLGIACSNSGNLALGINLIG